MNFTFPFSCVYHSPGDRAQKAIPEGAKTNESLWKSRNNFEKSILRFPFVFYYSPGDRAQKVIPGGAKTNESLWKSQNNVKKPILRFPTFLFTLALVIERKKLSLEARKQTRASESLKIRSNKTFLRFPSFLFTIALVIERKNDILLKY